MRSHSSAVHFTICAMGRPDSGARRAALKTFMNRTGLKAFPWASKAGISEGTIRNFLKGITEALNDSTYQRLADAASELLSRTVGAGELRGEQPVPAEIPLVGYVGAGAEIFPFDDYAKGAGLDMVPAPPVGGVDVVAVRVRGDSMWPVYRDGDVLFYTRDMPGITEAMIGQECVMKLVDGRTFIKLLHRGATKRTWTLRSWNAPDIEDVRLEWATPVRWVLRGG